jgi:hypothetical protein
MPSILAVPEPTTSITKSVLRRLSFSSEPRTRPELGTSQGPVNKRAPKPLGRTPLELQSEIVSKITVYVIQNLVSAEEITDRTAACFQGSKAPEIPLSEFLVRLVKVRYCVKK